MSRGWRCFSKQRKDLEPCAALFLHAQVFSLIHEERNRLPPEHTAYLVLIPNLSSWHAGPLDRLEPNPASDSHPYPVELRLPRWTVIEQPRALRELHLQQAQGVVELYAGSTKA